METNIQEFRQKITSLFDEYTSAYDISDSKIRLKVEHTYRVAELSDIITSDIADEYNMDENDILLAWVIAMLHDIGRFEQVKRYHTFWDSQSVDHAQFGADLLFGPQKDHRLSVLLPNPDMVETAIRNHNKYRLPDNLTQRELLFCNIIRDADKIDILKANLDFSMEEIYGASEEEFLSSDITDSVLNAALSKTAVERSLRKTHMDTLVSHASMMQELVFPISRRIVKERGYLKKLLDIHPYNPDTVQKLDILKKHMSDLL